MGQHASTLCCKCNTDQEDTTLPLESAPRQLPAKVGLAAVPSNATLNGGGLSGLGTTPTSLPTLPPLPPPGPPPAPTLHPSTSTTSTPPTAIAPSTPSASSAPLLLHPILPLLPHLLILPPPPLFALIPLLPHFRSWPGHNPCLLWGEATALSTGTFAIFRLEPSCRTLTPDTAVRQCNLNRETPCITRLKPKRLKQRYDQVPSSISIHLSVGRYTAEELHFRRAESEAGARNVGNPTPYKPRCSSLMASHDMASRARDGERCVNVYWGHQASASSAPGSWRAWHR